MILPTKYVSASDAVLGQAAALLERRSSHQTVSELWRGFADARPTSTFDRFTEALTLLHLMGLVSFDRGLLEWKN